MLAPLGVPVLNVMSSFAPAGLHSQISGVHQHRAGGLGGEEGCLRQSKVLPPPLANAKVFPALPVRMVFIFCFCLLLT